MFGNTPQELRELLEDANLAFRRIPYTATPIALDSAFKLARKMVESGIEEWEAASLRLVEDADPTTYPNGDVCGDLLSAIADDLTHFSECGFDNAIKWCHQLQEAASNLQEAAEWWGGTPSGYEWLKDEDYFSLSVRF